MSNKFYNLPPSWNPGYAIPEYVMAEPPGRGTFTTKWLPRGSISTLDPSFVADPGKRLLGRTDAGLGSLGDTTVGGSSTLSGSSLGGGRVYNLEPFGIDSPAQVAVQDTLAAAGIGADWFERVEALVVKPKPGSDEAVLRLVAALTPAQRKVLRVQMPLGMKISDNNSTRLVGVAIMGALAKIDAGWRPSTFPTKTVAIAAGLGLAALYLLKRKGR